MSRGTRETLPPRAASCPFGLLHAIEPMHNDVIDFADLALAFQGVIWLGRAARVCFLFLSRRAAIGGARWGGAACWCWRADTGREASTRWVSIFAMSPPMWSLNVSGVVRRGTNIITSSPLNIGSVKKVGWLGWGYVGVGRPVEMEQYKFGVGSCTFDFNLV